MKTRPEVWVGFRQHPWAATIESLPGMGPGLGAEFLVEPGGDLSGFASSGPLASYAGLVPVPRDSGRVSGNLHRPRRYNRRLRRVFYMAALSSLHYADGPSRRFYDPKRSERQVHAQALLARQTAGRRALGPAARRSHVHPQHAGAGGRCGLARSLRLLSSGWCYQGRSPSRSRKAPVGVSGPPRAKAMMASVPSRREWPSPPFRSVAVMPGSAALMRMPGSSCA